MLSISKHVVSDIAYITYNLWYCIHKKLSPNSTVRALIADWSLPNCVFVKPLFVKMNVYYGKSDSNKNMV